MNQGKGDRRRPRQVAAETFAARWDRTFGHGPPTIRDVPVRGDEIPIHHEGEVVGTVLPARAYP